MNLRHAAVAALLPVVLLGGCKKRQPETGPSPDPGVGQPVDRGTAEDSIRMAEERRLAAERAEAERRARERAEAAAREILTEIVFFDYDSDAITPEGEQVLQRKVAVMQENPSLRLRIEGHADQRGSTEYNLALGQRRAESVRAYLAEYGISPDRFTSISYGKERPLADGEGEQAWSRNRRAEFAVLGGGR